MKRLLLPVCIAFFSAAGNQLAAQPSLTAASNNLQIGDRFHAHQTIIGAPEMTTGALAGANQTWNFSTLTSAGVQQAEVLGRAAAPKPTDYPAANMVVKIGNEYAYLENNGTVLKEHALFESVQSYTLENTDPAEKLKFPLAFNDTFTDTYAGTVVLAGNTIPRIGNVTVTAEGYGTLVLPSGTTQNVLKLKTEEISNAGTMFSENTVTYDWFQPGIHFPLLRMTRRVSLMGTIFSGVYLDLKKLGAKEDLAAQINLQLFPNPTSNVAHIQFELKKVGAAKLTITNLLGQEVAVLALDKAEAGLQNHTLDVAGYAKGIYLVQLEMEGKVAVKRLVVQ
ncbi:T9SS type A sorting domain-containing protein [Adhaeribacter sp. BT258]|uniref:T9SS type A sorting domain-containing protein n=1 Tax=Adhaeribacter terrigena TaxID=2793070 RepID=A0ABS1C552_9BACT|nr:T9SS type A sorting domain-containing protein [Adhaeribacter terrigena]MBK0404438.1 T9SS type A sorting domain-containing protein [Adhaeribacter terrigena]